MSRILAVPVLVALFYVPGTWARVAACAVFVCAALTDFFDGFLARAWRQQSNIGRFLDPVADKLLVTAAIVLLIAFGLIDGWLVLAALFILCREILVSGLREHLAGLRMSVPVSLMAKWKTAVQMTAIGALILADVMPPVLPLSAFGQAALWLAAALSAATGLDYVRGTLARLRGESPPPVVDGAGPIRRPG